MYVMWTVIFLGFNTYSQPFILEIQVLLPASSCPEKDFQTLTKEFEEKKDQIKRYVFIFMFQIDIYI